jgi:hypothetical protein
MFNPHQVYDGYAGSFDSGVGDNNLSRRLSGGAGAALIQDDFMLGAGGGGSRNNRGALESYPSHLDQEELAKTMQTPTRNRDGADGDNNQAA